MTRVSSNVRQQDVTRALRAARAAGLAISGFEVDPATGKITVNTAEQSKQRRTGDSGDTPEGVKALL